MAKGAPAKLAYSVFEPEGGTDATLSPVIYLHGVTSTKEVWDQIPQSVANRTKRKAFALDARNHGDSEYLDEFNFDLNVVDLFHFMDTMKIQRAVLVGHSMGGLTAAIAALQKPERIEMVFSEDMYVRTLPKQTTDSVVEYIKLWVKAVENIPCHLNEDEASRYVVDIMQSEVNKAQEFNSRKEDIYKEKVVFRRKEDGGYGVKFNEEVILRALENHETLMSEPTGQYSGPAYFLYGSASPVEVHKEEDNIRRLFPRAELIEYKDATHNVHIEFPDKFINDLVLRLNKK